jgi:hypothetical protein
MKTIDKYLVFCISILLLFSCQKETRKVQNIETFGKLYGYARWFHPSDEAQEIDWDKFAILGVQKVENINSDAELRDTLFRLFSPIVQGLQISVGEIKSPINLHSLIPSDTLNNKIVTLQHYGVYLGEESNIYKSIRTNKLTNNFYSFFVKSIFDISDFRGKEIKLTGYFKIKTSDSKGEASLFLCPMTKNETLTSFTKLLEKDTVNITSSEWKKYEIISRIDNNAEYIHFGGALKNDISLLADNFTISVKNGQKWVSKDDVNLDFETGKIDFNIISWQFIENGHNIELAQNETYSGKFALKVEYTGNQFEKVPKLGEYTYDSIGNNLYCIIPLALCDVDGNTYPKINKKIINEFKKEISNVNISDSYNLQTNLASVIIAWNVFQHFYPYFDVIETNWEKVLPETLEQTYSNSDKADFTKTLSKMVAKLEDGHGVVYGERMYHLPIRTELIGHNIVITASNDPKFKIGDIIKKVNGVESGKVQEEMEKQISGSPQLRQHRALNVFGSTFHSEIIKFLIERDGKELSFNVQNNSSCKNMFFNPINNFQYKSIDIKELEPDIFYVNLGNCTSAIFTKHLEKLAKAKSVIYDYRWGGSMSLIELIPHLIDTTVNSAWWNIPQVVYPNRKEITFDKTNWSLPPQLPRFTSKSIIVTAPCVVSSGETEMGIINHYKLATTVGEPTAGCNGNVNWINLPCGYKVMWTGMKVLKHDGNQHHLIGFLPDYPVKRTMEGIKNDKDEILEKAIKIAENKNAP